MKDEGDQAREPSSEQDQGAGTTPESELDAVSGSGEEERLRVLEDIYNTLEHELEGDLDQEDPPRH